jgi:hypothetical protein
VIVTVNLEPKFVLICSLMMERGWFSIARSFLSSKAVIFYGTLQLELADLSNYYLTLEKYLLAKIFIFNYSRL